MEIHKEEKWPPTAFDRGIGLIHTSITNRGGIKPLLWGALKQELGERSSC